MQKGIIKEVKWKQFYVLLLHFLPDASFLFFDFFPYVGLKTEFPLLLTENLHKLLLSQVQRIPL